MTIKEKVLRIMQDLPEDASIEDAIKHLLLLAKIEKGILQVQSGQTIPHAQVKEGMAKWLKLGRCEG